MEDFNGLASSLAAGVIDVRGCLILSSDGLVLGSHPMEGEGTAKGAWMRFAAVGDPERGFAQFGAEIWCYVRRGPYAAFAVVGPAARPGLVIDHMEQVLLAAEETRSRREGVRYESPPVAVAAPSGKPRTPLHRESEPLEEPLVIGAVDPLQVSANSGEAFPASDLNEQWPATVEAVSTSEPPGAAEPIEPPPSADPDGGGIASAMADFWESGDGGDEDDEVDRFSLAREFRQLLQDGETGADG